VSVYAPVGAGKFGLVAGGAANPAMQNTGMASLATPSAGSADEGKPWHPSSPLFWVGALGVVTFGFMAVSTSGSASVRLGKATATVTGGAGVGSK